MAGMTDEELRSKLETQGVVDFTRIKKTSNGKETQSFILKFCSSNLPDLIKITSWHYEMVDPYIPSPMRCRKCQKLGHTSNQCRNTTENCANCCNQGHSTTECQNATTCINCNGNHLASDSNCPHYLMRKEILKTQLEDKSSFRQAKAKVRVSYALQGKKYTFETPSTTNDNPQVNQSSTDDPSQSNSTNVTSTKNKADSKKEQLPEEFQCPDKTPDKVLQEGRKGAEAGRKSSLNLKSDHPSKSTRTAPTVSEKPTNKSKYDTRKNTSSKTPNKSSTNTTTRKISGATNPEIPIEMKSKFASLVPYEDMDSELSQVPVSSKRKKDTLEDEGSLSKKVISQPLQNIQVLNQSENRFSNTIIIDPSDY